MTTTTPRPDRRHWAALIEDRVLGALGAVLRSLGWIPRVEAYTGYGTPRRVRILGRVLLSPVRTGRSDPQPAQRGFRSFLAVPAPRQQVTVLIGSTAVVAVSDRAGYIDLEVGLDDDAELKPGWQAARLVPAEGSTTPVRAGVVVIGDDVRLGVISDIDDTAMVTAVPTLLVAAWNMLWVRTARRVAVRGMADLYGRIAERHPDAPFVYLSAGAWNTARTLRRFLVRHGYPPGPLLLTDFGPTPSSWFRSGSQHKRTSLQHLFRMFPHMSWVLFGDDGQKDPEIYTTAAREHPEKVVAIGIRTLTGAERVIATAGAAKDGPTALSPVDETSSPAGAPYFVGKDGTALAEALETVPGLIAE